MAYQRRTVGRSRSRRSRGSRSNRRTSLWVRTAYNSGVIAGGLANWGVPLVPTPNDPLSVGGDLDPGARIGSTVVRVLATVEITGPALTNSIGGYYVGAAVADASDFALNTAPPILPVDDANSVNWAYWDYIPNSSPYDKLGYLTAGTETSQTFKVDVKSKRRFINPNDQMFLVIQAVSVAGRVGVNVAASTLLHLA